MASAMEVVARQEFPILISDDKLFPGTWQTILLHVSLLPDPPLFIVASRVADERLWAEALNLGAWDVLTKPFDSQEVTRVVASAWRHWQGRSTPSGEQNTSASAGIPFAQDRQMQTIVLTEDDLKLLERRFGSGVREMGTWSSDGTFGYSCVSLALVEKAVESLQNPGLMMALSGPSDASERTPRLIALLDSFGECLIERIVAFYREAYLELNPGTLLAERAPERLALERGGGIGGHS